MNTGCLGFEKTERYNLSRSGLGQIWSIRLSRTGSPALAALRMRRMKIGQRWPGN